MSSRFQVSPLLFLAGTLGVGVGQAEDFIRLRVESFSLQRQQEREGKKKMGISQSLYKRKVVKGRLCMGTRGSTLRLHWATRGLGATACCSQRSLAISAGNCGSASEARGGKNHRGRGAWRDAGRTLSIPYPLLGPGSLQRVHFHPLALGEFQSVVHCWKQVHFIF